MIKILQLKSGKWVFISGNSIDRDEADEIIIALTKLWGSDIDKQELCDRALEMHAESRAGP